MQYQTQSRTLEPNGFIAEPEDMQDEYEDDAIDMRVRWPLWCSQRQVVLGWIL